jgi:hypothetical protein
VGVVFLVVVLLERLADVVVLSALRCLTCLDFGRALPHREGPLVGFGEEERSLVGTCLVVPILVEDPAPGVDREWMGS